MRAVTILGSTGSIGRQAVEIAQRHPGEFRVVGLAARQNADLLMRQATRLRPARVAMVDEDAARDLATVLPAGIELLSGVDALEQLAAASDTDIVLNGIVGFAGLDSTVAALRAGKTLALANKESLVVGGQLVLDILREAGGSLVPVDSEHSALFQCLVGEDTDTVRHLILTGSGGPFRGLGAEELASVTVERALAHPTWNMGAKITIDSATLMNKGLEIIEAHYLFDIDYGRIAVLIHPQSIVHSMVEFVDGSVKAQMGLPDMRTPIQYALSYPERLPAAMPPLDLAQIGQLTFEEPDTASFPALRLARESGVQGKTYPAVLNAANEVAVARFLERRIGFCDILGVIESALEKHSPREVSSVDDLKEADRWARDTAAELCEEK